MIFERWFGDRAQVIFRRFAVSLVLLWLFRSWVWMPALVSGSSMLPTLQDGQIVGVNKLAYCLRPPQRGDLVAVWTGRLLMVKRVVGLPGDRIAISEGVVNVNGLPLQEPYVKDLGQFNLAPGTLAPGGFVVVGDNRSATVLAVVRQARIVGKLTLFKLPHGEEANAPVHMNAE
jgi:signal peptidase I